MERACVDELHDPLATTVQMQKKKSKRKTYQHFLRLSRLKLNTPQHDRFQIRDLFSLSVFPLSSKPAARYHGGRSTPGWFPVSLFPVNGGPAAWSRNSLASTPQPRFGEKFCYLGRLCRRTEQLKNDRDIVTVAVANNRALHTALAHSVNNPRKIRGQVSWNVSNLKDRDWVRTRMRLSEHHNHNHESHLDALNVHDLDRIPERKFKSELRI
jgi:hypothetical protein